MRVQERHTRARMSHSFFYRGVGLRRGLARDRGVSLGVSVLGQIARNISRLYSVARVTRAGPRRSFRYLSKLPCATI